VILEVISHTEIFKNPVHQSVARISQDTLANKQTCDFNLHNNAIDDDLE